MAVTVNGGDVTVGVMVAKTIEVDVVKTGKILVVVDVTVTVTACEARLKVLISCDLQLVTYKSHLERKSHKKSIRSTSPFSHTSFTFKI